VPIFSREQPQLARFFNRTCEFRNTERHLEDR
jgi:hypothetical protein